MTIDLDTELLKVLDPEASSERIQGLALKAVQEAASAPLKEGLAKQANIGKVKAFMSQGMDAAEAVKKAYPSWSDEQVQALAARLGGQTKTAKLRIGDIEDELGDYLSDADEARVRKMISKARKKSFSMRHPYLTGIPTLGIAPMIANDKAKSKIIRRLARSDPKLRKQLRKMRERARREEHEISVAEARAPRQYTTQKTSVYAGFFVVGWKASMIA